VVLQFLGRVMRSAGYKTIPALSVFQVAFLPLIAGTLLAGVEPKHVSIVIARNKPLAWLLLTVVVGLAITRVVRDSTEAFRSRVIEPLEFRQDRATFLKKEKELRDAMAKGATDFCGKDGIREYTPAECYLNFTKVQFPTAPPTLWTAGGLVSWWQRLMSLQAVLIIALLIWYLLLSGFARSRPPRGTFDTILVSLALFAAWFPTRLYGDWYVHFRSFERLSRNGAFIVAACAFVITLGAVLALQNRRPVVKLLAGGVSGISAVVGIVAAVSPEGFGKYAAVCEGLDPSAFFTIELLLFLFLLAILRSVDTNAFPTSPNRSAD